MNVLSSGLQKLLDRAATIFVAGVLTAFGTYTQLGPIDPFKEASLTVLSDAGNPTIFFRVLAGVSFNGVWIVEVRNVNGIGICTGYGRSIFGIDEPTEHRWPLKKFIGTNDCNGQLTVGQRVYVSLLVEPMSARFKPVDPIQTEVFTVSESW